MKCPDCDKQMKSKSKNTFECTDCDQVYHRSKESNQLKKSNVAHG